MLITVKNNGKGAQGIYAEGAEEAVFVGPGRARRFTVTDDELKRIERIRTLAIVNHDDPRASDPLETEGVKALDNDNPTTATDQVEGEVEHPVLEPSEGDDTADKPWEAPAGKRGRK